MKHIYLSGIAFSLTILSILSCNHPVQEFTENEKQVYLKIGDSLAKQTFDTLRNTLLREILREGAAGAVGFCMQQADALTHTYNTREIRISRISDLYRNPQNKPDSLGKEALSQMQVLKDQGETPQPVVIKDESGVVHYYKPILIQAMCLNCHGTVPGQIQPDVLNIIDSLYPGDLARQYKESELRGAWQILFSEKKDGLQ